jgi:hypothetical protein
VTLSLPMQQVQPSVSPQYGQTHLHWSMGSPQLSQWGSDGFVFFFKNSRLYRVTRNDPN